jgi:hypothetical protein
MRRMLRVINSVYGVASLVLKGVESLDVIDVMKGNGREWGQRNEKNTEI